MTTPTNPPPTPITMSDVVAKLQARLAGVLERSVEPLFKPGTKLTIIARTPGNNEADVLVTSDSLDGIAAVVERSRIREAT